MGPQHGHGIGQAIRANAYRKFGYVALVKEMTREALGWNWLDNVRRDVVYAFRTLVNNPSFTLVTLVTLALGIGANTAIFSLVNAVILKPLKTPNAARLVRIVTLNRNGPVPIAGTQQLVAWRRLDTLFEDVSAHRLEFVNLTGGQNPEQVPIARVTKEFFQLFGAPFAQGRAFAADEDQPGGPHAAVLSYGVWNRRYAGNPHVVGETIVLGSVPHLIVGVLGQGFDTEQFDPAPDVWVPFQIDPQRIDGGNLFQVTARLKRGVTLEMANAELKVAGAAFLRDLPENRPNGPPVIWAVQTLQESMVGPVRSSLNLLIATVAFVLLIACANVANLLLVRSDVRKREMAIRIAIGAGRRRIIWQLLTESIILSLVGGIIGLGIGVAGIRILLGLYPGSNPFTVGSSFNAIPRIGEGGSAVTVDWRVLTFTLVVSVVAGFVFGLLPGFQAARADPYYTLKETGGGRGSGRRQNRTRALIVVSEIALALLLLIGAALLIRTSWALRSMNPGFDSHNVLTMRMSVTGTPFEKRAGIGQLTRDGIERIRALPGVISASTTCCMPLEAVWQLNFVIGSHPQTGLTTTRNMSFHGFGGWTFVSPGYFDVFRIPIVRGRDFNERDNAGSPGVVIINETMARQFWPNSDPLGDTLIIGKGMRPEYDDEPVRQIVGIVGDVRDIDLKRNPRPAMYVPVAQEPDGVTVLNVRLLPLVWIVRTGVEPRSLSSAVEKQLQEASGGLPLARIRSMDDVISESTARARFDMSLMIIFAVSALLLAMVGVYGLISYSTQQRTHEIGIRLALGAESQIVRNMVLLQGMKLALAGIAIGSVCALGLSRLLSGFLFGVTARDPLVFVSAPIALGIAAFLAVWIPARWASRVTPMTLLRHD
jgi:putative ABC transport system permease protein